MIVLKAGVSLAGLAPQMVLAAHVVDGVYARYGVETCWITSANDGAHGPTTLHHKGQALDFRLHNVTAHVRPAVVAAIVGYLTGDKGFEVYWEGGGTPGEHLHVEYDPK